MVWLPVTAAAVIAIILWDATEGNRIDGRLEKESLQIKSQAQNEKKPVDNLQERKA